MTVDPTTCVRTLRLKVKSEAYPWLDAAAIEVNQVWNYAYSPGHRLTQVTVPLKARLGRSYPRSCTAMLILVTKRTPCSTFFGGSMPWCIWHPGPQTSRSHRPYRDLPR